MDWLRQSRCALILGFVLGAACALGVSLAVAGSAYPPWLQAAAAVSLAAAAAAALGLTWFLASAVERADRQRRARFMEDIGQLANTVEWRQSEAQLAVQAQDRPAFQRELIRLAESGLAADAFGRLPIEAWPSPTLYAQWTVVRRSLIDTATLGAALLAGWKRIDKPQSERLFLLAIRNNRVELGKFGEVWSLARSLK